jgi:hypothetical protein
MDGHNNLNEILNLDSIKVFMSYTSPVTRVAVDLFNTSKFFEPRNPGCFVAWC